MPELLSLNRAARRLGVPARWLRDEAEAGRVPSLPAGKGRFVFDFALMAEALSSRIRKTSEKSQEADNA